MSFSKFSLLLCSIVAFCIAPTRQALAADSTAAADAVNALGIDLLARVAKPNENVLISPYSIQCALAMAYAGAAGDTKGEMARVLHFPSDEGVLHGSFAALQHQIEEIHNATLKLAKEASASGEPSDPITLQIANRLYGQDSFAFRPEFLALLRDNYGSPFQPVDFKHDFNDVAMEINGWVADFTHQRIRDLVPPDSLSEKTRLVLVNAVFLKAPWSEAFESSATKKETFYVNGSKSQELPTMVRECRYGYKRGPSFRAVTLSYLGDELQLLVLLPDKKDGLADLEARLNPDLLADCGWSARTEVILHLPKFKFEPAAMQLGSILRSLGMKRAFDQPRSSADFSRMAPRKLDDYLYVLDIFHKTFIAVDEKGTEAAAATGVVMLTPFGTGAEIPEPIEIKIDHPFLFAIQHRASGACLFLGRVVDPR